jgi:hypothetical protein
MKVEAVLLLLGQHQAPLRDAVARHSELLAQLRALTEALPDTPADQEMLDCLARLWSLLEPYADRESAVKTLLAAWVRQEFGGMRFPTSFQQTSATAGPQRLFRNQLREVFEAPAPGAPRETPRPSINRDPTASNLSAKDEDGHAPA